MPACHGARRDGAPLLHEPAYEELQLLALDVGVYGRMRPGPNGAGLSRNAISAEIDDSLRPLGMDYVDLYQIHRFDHDTPIEETLEALHDIVKTGKARYIGCLRQRKRNAQHRRDQRSRRALCAARCSRFV